jgi:hypothetical protein
MSKNKHFSHPFWIFTGMLLGSMAFPSLGTAQCYANGKIFPVGHKYPVDQQHQQTTQWHKEFQKEFGVLPDGGAYKMAICSFVVDPETGDFPSGKDRKYLWVSSVDSNQEVAYSDSPESLGD